MRSVCEVELGIGDGGSGGGGGLEGAVSLWVEASGDEFSLDVSVPVVLDLVVGSTG